MRVRFGLLAYDGWPLSHGLTCSWQPCCATGSTTSEVPGRSRPREGLAGVGRGWGRKGTCGFGGGEPSKCLPESAGRVCGDMDTRERRCPAIDKVLARTVHRACEHVTSRQHPCRGLDLSPFSIGANQVTAGTQAGTHNCRPASAAQPLVLTRPLDGSAVCCTVSGMTTGTSSSTLPYIAYLRCTCRATRPHHSSPLPHLFSRTVSGGDQQRAEKWNIICQRARNSKRKQPRSSRVGMVCGGLQPWGRLQLSAPERVQLAVLLRQASQNATCLSRRTCRMPDVFDGPPAGPPCCGRPTGQRTARRAPRRRPPSCQGRDPAAPRAAASARPVVSWRVGLQSVNNAVTVVR